MKGCVKMRMRTIDQAAEYVRAIDPDAFFVVTDAKDVFGNGFGNINDD